jgi:putative transposase
MAVRLYLRHPLSAASVMELLAERGIDVSNRTVLRWVQTLGLQLAAEARKHQWPLGRSWYTDEMFLFRGQLEGLNQWLVDGIVRAELAAANRVNCRSCGRR